jgi:alpha-L-rhamnosidase
MKGNFCDIPTDCPTRERAGWTGDAGIFVNTGLYLMDCRQIYEKWLASCRANQYKSGAVRNIVPRNNEESFFGKLLSASAGWGDAIIIVTYTLYKRYGEQSIIRENYEAMKKWLMFLRKRAKKGCIKKLFSGSLDSFYDVTSGLDYGEWAEPDIEFASGVDMKGKSGVATAYLSYSARILAEMADIIGKHEDAKEFLKISQGAKRAYQRRFISNGIIESDRQKDYVRPIAFGLLEEKDISANAKKLNDLVEKMDYHLNTGFLSTPFLCKVLADNGYVETAYKLLLQETKPSWLYEVNQGATTVWETWDGKASQNHYSYGAICEWLIEGVCGLQYTFDELVLKPLPSKQLQYARVSYKSPKGVITVGWHYEDDKCLYSVELPDGLSGKLIKPNGEKITIKEKCTCEL